MKKLKHKTLWVDPKQFGNFNLIHAYEKTDNAEDIEYLSREYHESLVADMKRKLKIAIDTLIDAEHTLKFPDEVTWAKGSLKLIEKALEEIDK